MSTLAIVAVVGSVYWRLRGLWDAWRGKTGWEKFARVGFREGVAPAHG